MSDFNNSVSSVRSPSNKWIVLAAILTGSLLAPLDSSIINTVLPAITSYFHTDISIVQWVPTVYLLAISCLIVLSGRLGDIIGHKRIFLYGLIAFIFASVLCGISQNIWMLIAFRLMQGLAASMTVAVGFALVTQSFPASERGKALGLYALSSSIAMAIGPTLGGFIADRLSWHWIFFINAPIGIIAFFWCSLVIPSGSKKPDQRLDYPGAITIFIFLPTLLLYFNRGAEWGWASPVSLALLAIAIIFGALFFQIERKSKQPMLSFSLFSDRVFSFAYMSSFLYFIAFSTFTFLTPFYMRFVLHYSLSKVGLVMITYPIVSLFVAPLAGTLSDRIGTKIFTNGGMWLVALGLILLSTLKETGTAFNVILPLAIISFGANIFLIPNNSTIMGSVPQQHMGIASGLLAAMRYIGMVFGIAIAGAILYTLAPVSATSNPDSFSPADIKEFIGGLHWAYLAGAAAAICGALSSLLASYHHPKKVEGNPSGDSGIPSKDQS